MMEQNIELDTKELLALIHKMLTKVFFGVSRSEAKRLFQAIAAGDQVPFMTMELRKSGQFVCQLALDSSEAAGNVNFSIFRNALEAHLRRIAGALQKEQPINVFINHETDDIIFHHPGVIEADGRVIILVSGIEQRKPGSLCIKLQFLDPAKMEEAISSSRKNKATVT